MCIKTKEKADNIMSSAYGRGTRTRTQNKGFGDPRVTITPYPYVATRLFNHITNSMYCQAYFCIL